MHGEPYFSTELFVLAAAVLIGTSVFPTTTVGQTKAPEVSGDCSVYASVPLPEEAKQVPVPKTFPACASYRSYRGIGRPLNYLEARKCAWQERLAQRADLAQNQQEPTAWVVGGSLILADIYFNGAGVERNIPLAMRFACEFEEGTVKLALPYIEKLDDSSRPRRSFEFCDYAATTFTMNFCGGYAAEIEDDRRGRYFSSLKSSMGPEQQKAFENLLAAHNAYIEAHVSEVDQGGTIRAIRTIGSQNILKDLFRTEIAHFEKKKWPALSDAQITMADTSLHREYEKTLQQLRSRPEEETYEGAVTAESVSSAQKAWETYRDAWVTFARLRYPGAADAIRAEITFSRCRLLKTIR